MAVPNEVYGYLKEFEEEYSNHWERIPETDERLLKVRLLLNVGIGKNGKRVGRGSRTIVWTEEMDTHLYENKDKTAKELGDYFGIDHQVVSRRKKTLGITSAYQKNNVSGILFTDAGGKEHHYDNVTDARIATKTPRRIIYKALKIGKEWRYA